MSGRFPTTTPWSFRGGTDSVRGFQLSANYTWSHTISDAPDANSFEQNLPIENPFDRSYDRANSIVNRPQAFNMSVYIAPHVLPVKSRWEITWRMATN